MSEINIENIDFEKSNITFVDGLTLETVHIKYNWLLNAKIKDAVIGENANGIVWYFGDWLCGEWVDGTWYSGNFLSGTWIKGNFYSYKLNKFEVLTGNFNILDIDNTCSVFKGIWNNGTFFSGTFGDDIDEDWSGYVLSFENGLPQFIEEDVVVGGYVKNIKKEVPLWLTGIFKSGIFKNSIWNNGKFFSGEFNNSQWIYGEWYNGYFIGYSWYDGKWYNGEFLKGNWYNGIFTKLKKDEKSYFGSSDKNYICNWYNGTFKNGDFFSNINIINNIIKPSEINNLSFWFDGIFENGTFWGGHFIYGIWKNGIWKNGIFGNISYETSYINPNYVYQKTNILNTENWSGNTNNVILSDTIVNNNTSETYTWEYFNYEKIFDIDNIINDSSFNILGNYEKYINLIDDIYKIYTVDNFGIETERTLSIISYDSINKQSTFIFSDSDNDVDITYKMKLIIRRPVTMILNNNYLYNYATGITKLTSGYFTIETECNLYNVDDYIWVETYQNKFRITNITQIGSLYYLRINKNFNNTDIVEFLRYDIYEERNSISENLILHEFNFDFESIENTNITGIYVNADIEIISNRFKSNFNNFKISLPLKNLTFSGFDNLNNPEYNSLDDIEYCDIYRTNPEYPVITGYKIYLNDITSTINVKLGSYDDTWGIKQLEKYYNDNENYNILKINTLKNNIRISLKINLNNSIDSIIKISNINIKAIYSNSDKYPKWYDGIFEKGSWLNGDFINGKIKSINVLRSNIYGGKIGYNNR